MLAATCHPRSRVTRGHPCHGATELILVPAGWTQHRPHAACPEAASCTGALCARLGRRAAPHLARSICARFVSRTLRLLYELPGSYHGYAKAFQEMLPHRMQDRASVPLPGAAGRETRVSPPRHPPFPPLGLHRLQPRAAALQGPTLRLWPGLGTLSCRPGSSKGLVAGVG